MKIMSMVGKAGIYAIAQTCALSLLGFGMFRFAEWVAGFSGYQQCVFLAGIAFTFFFFIWLGYFLLSQGKKREK